MNFSHRAHYMCNGIPVALSHYCSMHTMTAMACETKHHLVEHTHPQCVTWWSTRPHSVPLGGAHAPTVCHLEEHTPPQCTTRWSTRPHSVPLSRAHAPTVCHLEEHMPPQCTTWWSTHPHSVPLSRAHAPTVCHVGSTRPHTQAHTWNVEKGQLAPGKIPACAESPV